MRLSGNTTRASTRISQVFEFVYSMLVENQPRYLMWIMDVAFHAEAGDYGFNYLAAAAAFP